MTVKDLVLSISLNEKVTSGKITMFIDTPGDKDGRIIYELTNEKKQEIDNGFSDSELDQFINRKVLHWFPKYSSDPDCHVGKKDDNRYYLFVMTEK